MPKVSPVLPGKTVQSLFSRQWLFVFLLAFCCFTFVQAQPGLVASYPFDGTFSDQSDYANHALATGNPTFTTDRHGQAGRALSLSGCGNAQFLRVPHSASLQLSQGATFAFWAKIDLSSGMDPGTGTCNVNGRQVFFSKAGDGWGTSRPGIQGLTYPQSGQQRLDFESSTNSGQVNTGTLRPLPGAAWHHYAYVLSTSQVRLFVDGQLVHTQAVSLSFAEANGQDLYLGVMGPKTAPVLGVTYWYPLAGALDDFRVFNRALTDEEISTVYTADCDPVAVLPAGDVTICDGQQVLLQASLPANVQAQWLRNGQPIPQATLDSLLVTQSGAYQVEATPREGLPYLAMPGPGSTLNDLQFVGGTSGWIVGDHGTLLKTTNGSTWDTIPTGRTEHLYAVHFVNTQIGWMGGASGLLLKSTNGGTSWSPQSLPVTGSVQKIQFFSEQAGYVLADRLLFKTTNGGSTWTTVTLPTASGLEDIAFVDADFGWIASDTQIYKTENGGSTWSLQKTVTACLLSKTEKVYALDRNSCWAFYTVCPNNLLTTALVRTSNGGATWTEHNIVVPANFPSPFTVADVQFTDVQNGYAIGRVFKRQFASGPGVNGGAVFRTSDGGQTWSMDYDNPYETYPLSISFRNSSTGLVVGRGGLMVNVYSAGGIYNNYFTRTYQNLNSVAGVGNYLLAVGGTARDTENGPHPDSRAVTLTSTSAGQSWTKQENMNAYTLYQVKFKNNQFGWRVGYGVLSRTTDGGATWNDFYGNTMPQAKRFIISKAYFQTETTGWYLLRNTSFGPASLYRFSGTSQTLENVPYKDANDPYETTLLDLQFVNDNVGFVTTSNGKLIKTTNGGTTWTVHLVKANHRLSSCFFVSEQVGWVLGENGLVLKTTNGGQSWTEQPTGFAVSLNGLNFLSEQVGYVVGGGGTLLKTTNGGTSWSRITTGTFNTLNDINFSTPGQAWIVGEWGTVLKFDAAQSSCTSTSLAVNVTVTPGGVCESVASGAWGNAATWGCGRVPLVCDQVIISPNHVVSLSDVAQVRGVEIRQNGQLSLQGGNLLVDN
ncbi:hypothetical protein GCM10027275_09600 [Rhabdobacter roseus]|uniref:Photosystem II stability/assembly factor-like uncharacterized protein n=1 Tax=Rhabdobacter roseus TaxID=1655419 RepID=A0A840THV4_9BACT|nr:YCF48-related protein [Rhabdobacter roseus]MBB5282861.1 photosystem II stability/assembly factor-like uncharacterized protein [Rhabdobacter roseus]